MTSSTMKRGFGGLWLLAALLAAFLGWAAWFEIDQTVRAQGQLIPSAHTQVIQAVDGGVLKEIRVREGQSVKQGEVLAVLEKERSQAGVEENQAKYASQQAALERLSAEVAQRAPHFAPALVRRWPQFVQAQQNLYQQRQTALRAELANLDRALQLARDELGINQRLEKSGDVAVVEVMRAQRQVIELESRKQGVLDKYRADAQSEFARVQDEQSSVGFRLEERESVLKHTEITAPMAGIVKFVRVTTEGGVLRQGDELMQISPAGEQRLIEVNINPADVGLLHAGLPVNIRLDAFDSAIYGRLSGELVYISPDTLSEQGTGTGGAAQSRAQVFYRAHVRLDPQQSAAGARIRLADLKPGMTATVDIRTGTRSVLTYLLKPINKSITGGLSEK